MRKTTLSIAIASTLALGPAAADELEPLKVTADLREISEKEIAASVSITDEVELQDRGATHFDDIIKQLPNVNYSGQSSRPRHIQIRGIGERDEYTGAPNSSVGFTVDDIDFSGIGMSGNLFDVQQVEVLRGPQGTRYGLNALAGLINIRSNDPTPYRENMAEITLGEDALSEFGVVTSGPFSAQEGSPQYRLALHKHDSNGFRHNAFLDRDDTNGRDELTLRGKLRFTPDRDTRIDLTLLHADLDNGYDTWALDNSFTTLSDQPGRDTQRSTAGAARVQWNGHAAYELISITTLADSDMEYGFDSDWVYPSYWTEKTGEERPFIYNYLNEKGRETVSQELRLVSKPAARLFHETTDWLVGLYALRLKEENETFEAFQDDFSPTLTNAQKDTAYTATNLAMFGQIDYHLSKETTFSGGLRIENRVADFENSLGDRFDPEDTMVGGHITLSHQLNPEHRVYAGITRGYKAGGFNAELPAGTDPALARFDVETLINYETGVKSTLQGGRLNTALSLFYMDRSDPQFDAYTTELGAYNFYTENFDSAINYGLEADFDWRVDDNWTLFGALGLLQTDIEGRSAASVYDIEDREQAHAPNYQYNLGAQYRNTQGYFARLEVTGSDAFYFDNVHNRRSEPYAIADARVGFESADWEVYLWGRNLFDERYPTRGFFIANDPSYGFDPSLGGQQQFIRLGDPRHFGITARIHF